MKTARDTMGCSPHPVAWISGWLIRLFTETPLHKLRQFGLDIELR
jgi:hypothetical protein